MPNLSEYSRAIIEAATRQENNERLLNAGQLAVGALGTRKVAGGNTTTIGGQPGGGTSYPDRGGPSYAESLSLLEYQNRAQRIQDAERKRQLETALRWGGNENVSPSGGGGGSTTPVYSGWGGAGQPTLNQMLPPSPQPSSPLSLSSLGSSLYDFFLKPK